MASRADGGMGISRKLVPMSRCRSEHWPCSHPPHPPNLRHLLPGTSWRGFTGQCINPPCVKACHPEPQHPIRAIIQFADALSVHSEIKNPDCFRSHITPFGRQCLLVYSSLAGGVGTVLFSTGDYRVELRELGKLDVTAGVVVKLALISGECCGFSAGGVRTVSGRSPALT